MQDAILRVKSDGEARARPSEARQPSLSRGDVVLGVVDSEVDHLTSGDLPQQWMRQPDRIQMLLVPRLERLLEPAVYPAPPSKQAPAMGFDLRRCEIMAGGHERPGSSATGSEDGAIIVPQCSMATHRTSRSTVSNTQQESRNREPLGHRTHHRIEMSELLGRGPGALHTQDELVGSERAEEFSNVDFRPRQRSGEFVTCQMIAVQ